jgi:DNA-directed RNA polymerase subunit M/transcription elongation factor TFIIS
MGAVNMKSTTTQITGKCEVCGNPITPASTQTQFNRNKGLHMWRAHGKKSQNYQASKKYRQDRRSKVTDAENGSVNRLTQMLAKKPRKQQRTSLMASVPMAPAPDANVVPAQLDHCPNCHTRFFMAKTTTDA